MPTFHSRASLKLRLIIALLLLGLSSWYIFAGSSDSPHASFDLSSLSPPRLRNSRNSNSAPSPTLSSTPITKPILSNEPSIQVDEVISVFDSFLHQLHISFAGNKKATPEHVWQLYFDLAIKTLLPFDKHYAAHMPPRRDDDTIFLSLASYRDENCLPTLTGAYEKADNPAKLFVGLVQQNCLENCRSGVLESGGMEDVEPDDDCGKLFCEARPDLCSQVRVLRVNETEALGPYSGRYFGSKLWSGESWYMQIDSHMVFAQNWDSLSISMLNAAPAPKPVLTHYPPAHTSPLKGVGNRICDPLIADSNIEAQIVRLAGAPQYEKTVSKTPHFAPFVAAGYFVAHSSFLAEVPFDPLMPWIFMGEEISMSARLFTSGYDLFSPTQSVTGHIYVRKHKPKFWETFGRVFTPGMHNSVQLLIIQRLKYTLGYPEAAEDLVMPQNLLVEIDAYGMGKERTLKQYMDMVGVDVVGKKVTKMAGDWCRKGKPPPGFEQHKGLYK